MRICIVIPARIGSTRLKEKPLTLIDGKPLVRVVYESCERSGLDTYVFTDSLRVGTLVKNCVISSEEDRNGTERIAGCMGSLEDYDYIINVQGDMLNVSLSAILCMIDNAKENEVLTLSSPISEGSVEVSTDLLGYATSFKRNEQPTETHLGIYGYPVKALHDYLKTPQGVEEKEQSLEQLRWYSTNYPIKVISLKENLKEINTINDLSTCP